MKTFDVGVDLDGVGYNLQSTLAPYARKHGYPLATEQRWNRIDPETGRHGGFSSWGIKDYDEFLSLCSKAVNDGVLYSTGCPFPGFLSMMRGLAGDGHRIHIITSRTSDPSSLTARATRSWLGEWAVPHQTLTFSADKTQTHTDFFIEDSAHNYAKLVEHGMTVPYLVSRSWNLWFEAENRVTDLVGFADVVHKKAHPEVQAKRGAGEMVFLEPARAW